MTDNIAVMEQSSSSPLPHSKPRLVSSNVYTVEITDKFRDAASRLEAGSLIKDEYFTLFESVGALEIGDPKMDSGCVEEGESLEDGYDICKPLLPAHLMWLMDELLSCEVAWHMGYPLSQTLFTSVYIEKLLWPDPVQLHDANFTQDPALRNTDPLLHRLFRSYCLGLVKCCDLVLGMVTSQHYYEEEDFATQLYNRELLHRFSIDDILAEMIDAMHYLRGTKLDEALRENLEIRMQFRLNILKILSSHKTATNIEQSISSDNLILLARIRSSRALGMPLPDSFTLKIQRRLASTVPPRPMVVVDEARVFDYLANFLANCQSVFAVLSVCHSQDLFTSYSIYNTQDPQPSVYIRALMQSWLNLNGTVGGVSSEFDFITDDMKAITMAASPIIRVLSSNTDELPSHLKLVKQHVSDFLTKNSRSFLNIWRTVCLNRCRVRRTLCHAALEWDQLQAEAEELDDELQNLIAEPAVIYPAGGVPTFSYSLSSWIYHYKLAQLRMVVQMGFELDIYAPHEMPSMYWYLGHLCETHLAHLERIGFFIAQREATLPLAPQRSTREVIEAADCQANLRNLYRHFSWLKASEATSRALHGLYTVLQRNGQFQQPTTTYASDQLRFELRMRPFLYLSIPEPHSFEQWRRRCQMEVRSDAEILQETIVHVSTAKKAWEEVLRAKWHAFPVKEGSSGTTPGTVEELWVRDVRNAIKACISTSVAVTSLRKHFEVEGAIPHRSVQAKIPRKGEKDYRHPWWLVPRITF